MNSTSTTPSNSQPAFLYDETLLVKPEYNTMFQHDWMMNQFMLPQGTMQQQESSNDFVFYDTNHDKASPKTEKYTRKRNQHHQDKEKREQFLERNRQAALKCRQRKKKWLEELQQLVEFLSTDNEQLQTQANCLREEVLNLKTLLLAHVDCTVAQSNGTTAEVIQMTTQKYHPH